VVNDFNSQREARCQALAGAPAAAISAPGYRLGFVAPIETEAELAIRGRLPAWLRGDLLRVCAAMYETPQGWRARHHFDGLAMLYRFTLDGNRALFRNRFIRSRQFLAAQRGRRWGHEFAACASRGALERLLRPLAPTSDNTNINICRVGDRYLAVNESCHQYEFNPETLETLGLHRYHDNLPASMAMSAHPLTDPATGELINVAVRYGPCSEIIIYRIQRTSNERELIASYRTRRPPWLHSFFITPRYVILVQHPFSFCPWRFVLTAASVLECFDWRPAARTVFVVIDRATGARRYHAADSFLMIHSVNAYQDGEDLVLDLLNYPDPHVLRDVLTISKSEVVCAPEFASQPPYRISRLERFRLAHGRVEAHRELVLDTEVEFPAINEAAVRGRRYRYLYGVGPGSEGYLCRLHRFDLDRGVVRSWSRRDLYLGEPIFVARPGATDEGDGVLLVPALDGVRQSSSLVVLDAARLEELATVAAPTHLPFGFHGQFFRRP